MQQLLRVPNEMEKLLNDIKVQVEDQNILNVSGDLKRNDKEKGEVK